MSKTWFAQVDMHVDQPGRNDEALGVNLGNCGFRIADCGLFGDAPVRNDEFADFIATIRRIDDAAIADDDRFHHLFRVAHASRVLAKASRFRGLSPEGCFGETPKPTRETRALSGCREKTWLTLRSLRRDTKRPCARPGRWSPD